MSLRRLIAATLLLAATLGGAPLASGHPPLCTWLGEDLRLEHALPACVELKAYPDCYQPAAIRVFHTCAGQRVEVPAWPESHGPRTRLPAEESWRATLVRAELPRDEHTTFVVHQRLLLFIDGIPYPVEVSGTVKPRSAR